MRRRAAALVVALLCAACSGRAPTTPVEPTLGPVTNPSGPSAVARPIDRYRLDGATVGRAARSFHALLNDCLSAKGEPGGVTVPAADVQAFVGNPVLTEATMSSLWGWYWEPGQAGRIGYEHAGPPGLLTTPGANSPAAIMACRDEVQTKLPGNAMDWSALAQLSSLPQGGPAVPQGDSRVIAAVERWSGCLARRGFDHVASPLQAAHLHLEHPASPEALDLAVADDACKRETNLVGILLAVQSAYDARYIEANAGALASFKESVDAFLRDHPA